MFADRKARAQSLRDRIEGVGLPCALCGSGADHSGLTLAVAMEMFSAQREAFFTGSAASYHPQQWPTTLWSVCDPCVAEGYTVDPTPHVPGVERGSHRGAIATLYAAAKLLGVPVDRVLGDVINGRDGSRFADGQLPLYSGAFYFCGTRAKHDVRTSVRARWAHVLPDLQNVYAEALHETKVTHRQYAEGCGICRRTMLAITEGDWVSMDVSINGRNRQVMLCPTDAKAAIEARDAGVYDAVDIALADAAEIWTTRGLALHHGVDVTVLPAAEGPWASVDLHLLKSQFEASRVKSLATGINAVKIR